MDDSPVLMSRAANPDREYVEVRPLLSKSVVAYIDAQMLIEGKKYRQEMIETILTRWARQQERELSVRNNVVRGNPPVPESSDA